MRFNTSLKFLLLVVFSGITAMLFAGESYEHIAAGGQTRNYISYLPKSLEAGWNKSPSLPLVIALHGHGGTAEGMEKLTGFEALADKDKFLLVYPQGIDKNWNDGRGRNENVNDVEFISTLINFIVSTYPVDAKRIYVTGMSNGGFMAMRLAYDIGNRIAAVAAVGATIDTTIDARQTSFPVSIMLIHGTKDPLVNIDGGNVKRLPDSYILSHQALIASWVKRDHCNTTPSTSIIPDVNKDGTIIIKTDYTGGTNNTEVVSYVVENGGHTWPGGPQYLATGFIGLTSHNLDATQVIWEFFKAHPKQ